MTPFEIILNLSINLSELYRGLGGTSDRHERWAWGEAMAQQLGAPAAFAEPTSSAPGTHIKWLTSACNSDSRRSNDFSDSR